MDTIDLQKKPCRSCIQGRTIFPFSMAFQPIVDIQEHRIDAYEALVRGTAGEGAAQVLARVNDENRYAFDQSCRVRAIELAARLGMANAAPGVRLNINFLPNAVYEPKACIRLTLECAARTGFPLDRLTFEFVEHEDIADNRHTLDIIHEYRKHGFRIAMDDFATGYSGLARLATLKPDIVKLDRDLVQDCDQDRTRLAIIAAIVALGREIGIKIVCEGVERHAEYAALRSIGARYIQGYHFARPKFEALVQNDEITY